MTPDLLLMAAIEISRRTGMSVRLALLHVGTPASMLDLAERIDRAAPLPPRPNVPPTRRI